MTLQDKLATRDAYGETLVELGSINSDIVVLDADLSGSTRTSFFGRSFPERFFNMGIAEQDMMGTSAGLATTGKIVFASSFAMFATGRPWEIIRNSICYPKLNVKISATHAGITVGEDGASHQSLEDVSIMRALPNMQVFVPADYYEAKEIIKYVASINGPCYIRLSRSSTPVVYNSEYKFNSESYSVLREGTDVAILASGIMVHMALQSAQKLSKQNIQATVVNINTIKPFHDEQIAQIASTCGAIVTAEEHNIVGGLFGAVSESLAKHNPVPIEPVGIKDVFGESGSSAELLIKYGLTSDSIYDSALKAIKRKNK